MSLRRSLVSLAFLALVGCGGASTPQTSVPMNVQGVPSAQGTVTAREVDNNNLEVSVKVKHLAPPARIEPGATTYVVWGQPEHGGQVQNMGALMVDRDESGELTTITPMHRLDVFVTPESRPDATQPTGKHVLGASISR